MHVHFQIQRGLVLVICLLLAGRAFSQPAPASPLKTLRDQLVATNGWRESDVLAIISEPALNNSIQRLVGLEIKLHSGATLKITSVTIALKPAQALVKIGVLAVPSLKIKSVNLQLRGTLGNGEIHGAKLRLPFVLTDVVFGSEEAQASSFVKLLMRDWITPQKWNSILPPLEIPLQLNQVVGIPAAGFESKGELPMSVETPVYQLNLEFRLATLVILDGRLVMALNLQPKEFPTPASTASEETEAALMAEIAELSRHLQTATDVRLCVSKKAINSLFGRLAAARPVDLTVKLKQGRFRMEELDAVLGKILNYTDIESGTGQADVTQISLEQATEKQIVLRLSGEGVVQAEVSGREFGVGYHLSPHGTFSLVNQMIPLEFVNNEHQILIRARRGSEVAVTVNLKLDVIGHPMNLSRTIHLQVEKWLNDFALPEIFSPEVQLPRQITINKDGALKITRSEPSRYHLTDPHVGAEDNVVEITANIK